MDKEKKEREGKVLHVEELKTQRPFLFFILLFYFQCDEIRKERVCVSKRGMESKDSNIPLRHPFLFFSPSIHLFYN